MRVVVTGAAGMIGSNLVHGLNAIGIDDVIAVDDLSDGAKFRNLVGATLSDYGKGGLAHIPEMIRQARAAARPVLIDPKGSDYERYRGATAITPNRAELAQVIGTWSSEAQLRERVHALLAALDVAAIVLTRSEDGMSLFDAEGQLDLPAEAREVFDVTGAGDTVIATLAAMLAAGLDLRAALPLANRSGGIVVGKFGTATVSYDELFAARSAS